MPTTIVTAVGPAANNLFPVNDLLSANDLPSANADLLSVNDLQLPSANDLPPVGNKTSKQPAETAAQLKVRIANGRRI